MSTSETNWEPASSSEIAHEPARGYALFDAFLDKLERESPSELVAGIIEHEQVYRASQVALTYGIFKSNAAPNKIAAAILSDRGCYDLYTKREAEMLDAGQRQRVYVIRKALAERIFRLSETSYDFFCRALHYGDYAAAAEILEAGDNASVVMERGR